MIDKTPQSSVLFQVWLASRATTAVLDRALAPSGLTADDFAVYSMLMQRSMTPTELATWMAAPLTTVSSYVKRFEGRGDVQRLANPDDRRSYLVTLTPQGVEAFEAAGRGFLPVLGAVSDRLGAAVPEVEHALSLLHDAIQEAAASQ